MLDLHRLPCFEKSSSEQCVYVFLSTESLLLTEQNNKHNARDQASDVALRKLLCVKYLRRHVTDNHSMDLQASNCA